MEGKRADWNRGTTHLNLRFFHRNAAKVAKRAHQNGTTLKHEAVTGGFVGAEEFERLVRPELMIRPH